MNIVFFGTSRFALPALKGLLDSPHKVLALVTQPDRKKGRSLKLSQPPTKVLALTKNIPVYQPQNASGDDSYEYLKRLGAELFVVISFGQILGGRILSIPKIFSINVHGSLLPEYRGAAPTNWAVMNGDRKTGITVIKMNEKMDEGDIILQKEIGIDAADTNITLSEKLSELGAAALLETVDLIASGKGLKTEKQDSSRATYAPKLKKEDGLIDWTRDASWIHNRVRGLLPWPGAYTYYNARILKILRTGVSESGPGNDIKCGEVTGILRDNGIAVRTGSGDIMVRNVQLEGKKAMDFDAFARGHTISAGYIFKNA